MQRFIKWGAEGMAALVFGCATYKAAKVSESERRPPSPLAFSTEEAAPEKPRSTKTQPWLSCIQPVQRQLNTGVTAETESARNIFPMPFLSRFPATNCRETMAIARLPIGLFARPETAPPPTHMGRQTAYVVAFFRLRNERRDARISERPAGEGRPSRVPFRSQDSARTHSPESTAP